MFAKCRFISKAHNITTEFKYKNCYIHPGNTVFNTVFGYLGCTNQVLQFFNLIRFMFWGFDQRQCLEGGAIIDQVIEKVNPASKCKGKVNYLL